jgi:hypothetical protein
MILMAVFAVWAKFWMEMPEKKGATIDALG